MMAVRSRDFVGIAEGIKSHELSTKGRIEQLKGRMSELSGRRSSLNGTISYLEAAIAAAYENVDEDGDPDYGLIAALESQKGSAENELSGVEQDLDSTGGELEQSENELEAVMEEKAQTLFEIQERARRTSQNIVLAGGMYGAYAGVGGSLQSSMQTSLSALSQAAGILGGSVNTASAGSGGNSASGAGNSASGGGSVTSGNLSTGALSAFTTGVPGGSAESALPPASQFSSGQGERITPGTLPNFHSGQSTINPQKSQSFKTEQNANIYASSSFGEERLSDDYEQLASSYQSEQVSSELERRLAVAIEKDSGSKVGFHGPSFTRGGGQLGRFFSQSKEVIESVEVKQAKADLMHYQENESLYSYNDYSQDPQLIFVDPRTVLRWETGDKKAFWDYKGSGSKQKYLDLANEINTVKLLHGTKQMSYEQIAALGGTLGSCATHYFLEGAIRVEKVGQASIFQGDGRHRLEAAIEAGIDKIPILVVGEHRISAFRVHEDKLGKSFVDGMQITLSSSSHTDVKQLYEKYSDKLKVHDANHLGGAFFRNGEGVYMNASNVSKGDTIHKPFQTAFHEFGHNIDYVLGYGQPISESWGNGALLAAIKKDFEKLKGEKTNEEMILSLKELINKNNWSIMDTANVSDILECMTGISYPFGAGHGKKYWSGRSPCREFFAETLDSAAANETSYTIMKAMFPNAVAVVHEIIGGNIL